MEAKFKVGDKVIFTSQDKKREGTIKSVMEPLMASDTEIKYVVEDVEGDTFVRKESRLSLKPEPKFKKGARVIEVGTNSGKECSGEIVADAEFDCKRGSYYYEIKFDNNKGTYLCMERSLELEESKNLQIGDIVTVTPLMGTASRPIAKIENIRTNKNGDTVIEARQLYTKEAPCMYTRYPHDVSKLDTKPKFNVGDTVINNSNRDKSSYFVQDVRCTTRDKKFVYSLYNKCSGYNIVVFEDEISLHEEGDVTCVPYTHDEIQGLFESLIALFHLYNVDGLISVTPKEEKGAKTFHADMNSGKSSYGFMEFAVGILEVLRIPYEKKGDTYLGIKNIIGKE